jgi:Glycosyltransferase family 25 (LPS biosynthesis protein)
MTNNGIPFFVLNYTPFLERRAYIEREWKRQLEQNRFEIRFVNQHDREMSHVRESYTYDEKKWREMILPIKDLQIGYWLGLFAYRATPFHICVEWQRSQHTSLDQDFKKIPWFRPKGLSPGDVSIFWKHREAWTQIASSDFEYAVVAEDDIIFVPQSLKYLVHLLQKLPRDAEYVDIAGGAGFMPRAGNKCVNDYFFEIFPPKARTCCAYILSRSFARRVIEINPPICLPIDITLNWAFTKLNTRVHWVQPTVFGHGSELNVYPSFRAVEHHTASSMKPSDDG